LRYGFNGIFDFGIGLASVRYMSREWAVGASHSVNAYLSSLLFIYAAMAMLLAAFYGGLSSWIIPFLLRSESVLRAQAHVVFSGALAVYFLFLLSNPFYALLMSIQKVYLTHVIGTISLLIELVGIVVLIPFGLSLPRVLLVYAVNGVVCLTVSVLLACHNFPSLRVTHRLVSGRRAAELLSYGGKFSVTALTSLLNPILDKLILARFVGLWAVAWYEAAARLADLLRRATQLFLLPVLPMAGAMEQKRGAQEIQGFYTRIFNVNLIVSVGVYLLPAGLAASIFWVWMGPESGPGALAFTVLSVTYFCLALVGPLTLILAGTGRMKLLIITGLAGLSMNLTLTPLLASRYGFVGMLAGTWIAYGLFNLFYLAYTVVRIEGFALSARRFVPRTAYLLVAALLPGMLMPKVVQLGDGELSLLKFIASALISGCIYVGILLTSEENRQFAIQTATRLREAAFRRRVSV